jgi:hypothetical protein
MKWFNRPLALAIPLLVAGYLLAADATTREARVTRIVHDVQVLPADAPAAPAELNELVQENSGVRTGDESRSELTFVDLTITRLGANTIFSFNRAGRTAELESGQLLLRVPKNSGGATIKSSAVTVGITGTTVIFEGDVAGDAKLTVLEGSARMRLNANPKQSKRVGAGQMLSVNAGAKTLPDPEPADLNEIMQTNPLITDFPPLPSQNLINEAMNHPNNNSTHKVKPVVGTPASGVTTQPVVGRPIGYVPPGNVQGPPYHHHPGSTPTPHLNGPRPNRPRPMPTPKPKSGRPINRRLPVRPTPKPRPTPRIP